MKLILKNNLETHLTCMHWFYLILLLHVCLFTFYNFFHEWFLISWMFACYICSYKFLFKFNPPELIHKFEIIKKMAINIKELKRSALININDKHMPAQFNFVFKYIPQVRRMSLKKKSHPRERPSSPPSPTSRCVLQKPSPDQLKVVHIFFFFF